MLAIQGLPNKLFQYSLLNHVHVLEKLYPLFDKFSQILKTFFGYSSNALFDTLSIFFLLL